MVAARRRQKSIYSCTNLIYMLVVVGCLYILAQLFLVFNRIESPSKSLNQLKNNHKPRTLTSQRLVRAVGESEVNQMYDLELRPFLRGARVPGTPGNELVREHIISRLTKLSWDIEQDRFEDITPHGTKEFVNIIATSNPEAKRKLVLACHHDSKYFAPRVDKKEFVGATDSAVPCAIMLNVARTLDKCLKEAKNKPADVTLQLVFFDGEEAFEQWTDTDSLYGSRHLAEKMAEQVNKDGTNGLDSMDALVLLDLLGDKNLKLSNQYPNNKQSDKIFQQLLKIEKRLHDNNLMSTKTKFFQTAIPRFPGRIDDDHRPFLERGVNVVHLIASPFPEVWHKIQDDFEHLDELTIDNLMKIFKIFVIEYLHLSNTC